jgi:hypothetical protein
MIATYTSSQPSYLSGSLGGRLTDPTENFTYVIITNEALRDATGDYTFQDLLQSKWDKGLTATLVTVEDIEQCPDYWWNGVFGDGDPQYNDTACHIRNFIKDAYQTWNTTYILLGGDGDSNESGDCIIPARELFAHATISDAQETPSDLYYACLDGSFDANRNSVYGEPEDDPDLMAEVLIGRAPVDNAEDVSNFVRKTLSYEQSDDNEYLRTVWMVGERLGFGGIAEFGGNYKDEMIEGSDANGYSTVGIPHGSYDIQTLYDRDWPGHDWPKSEIISRINNGAHLINHLGHGNNYHVMKLDEPVIMRGGEIQGPCHDVVENLTNNQYFFLYSQACYPGAFDNKGVPYDCIVEAMLTEPHGAFACVANTRYGWGMRGSTDGPSQHFDREFWDAVFGEGKRCLGEANQDSKEDNIGIIDDDYGLIRYCYYELTLFGDPEVSLKRPPLRDHDLAVSKVTAPVYVLVGANVSIHATVRNLGSSDEYDLLVTLSVNGTVIDTRVISSLQSSEGWNVSFTWSTDSVGTYEIQVEVQPVSGETYLDNNRKTKVVRVVSQQAVIACSLDSCVTDFDPRIYDEVNEHWYRYGDRPVVVDCLSLNLDPITYEDIVASGADVLVIHAAFVPFWVFTLDEIDAITRYVSEGHGLLIIYMLFGGLFASNNDLLLPLVGLNSSFETAMPSYYYCDMVQILDEGHPLFNHLPNPFDMGSFDCTTPPFDGSWDENELATGRYVGKVCEGDSYTGAVVVNTNNAVYLSMTMQNTSSFYTQQLLYNALVFTGVPTTFGVWTGGPYTDFIVDEPIQFHGYVYGGVSPYTWLWEFGDEIGRASWRERV